MSDNITPDIEKLLREGKLVSAYDVLDNLMVFSTEQDRLDYDLYMMLGDLSIALANKRYEMGMKERDFAKFLGVSYTTYKKAMYASEKISLETYSKLLTKIGMYVKIQRRGEDNTESMSTI